jgi:NAD(P)-dependent dehydrogenase (short-subunit alcohol dehydrogenase family)
MHVLVTGSTRGIGAAVRAELTKRGARVVGHGSSASGEDEVAADLAQRNTAEQLWNDALAILDGRIDVVVNNAGVYEAVALDSSDEEWQRVWTRSIQINLQAAADLCRCAVRHFRSRDGGGRIVNVASRAAHRGDSPEHWHYAASKAALVAMTKTIARAYASDAIYAFAVAPGFTMTGMAEDYLASRGGEKMIADIPLGRVATAEEVANVIAYLALDAPAAMTGAVLDINGASYVR